MRSRVQDLREGSPKGKGADRHKINELCNDKSCFFHMRKQRCRSATQYPSAAQTSAKPFVFTT